MASHRTFSTARLEAFSDGVIAVIITIMVLELKVPHADGVAGLLQVAPIIAIYLLSFLFVGTYWINHHYILHRVKSVDDRVLWGNLFFLFTLSLLPFFTDYVGEKHVSSFSAALYSSSLLLSGFGFLILRLAIERRLKKDSAYEREDFETRRKHWLSLGLYLLSIPAAYVQPWLGLGLAFTVTIIWITPAFSVWVTSLGHTHESQ